MSGEGSAGGPAGKAPPTADAGVATLARGAVSYGPATAPDDAAMLRDAAAPIIAFGDVGSTNDEAMAHLRAGDGPLWVTAVRQLAGRGRRGRAWTSEPGNLYASYATPSDLAPDAFGILPLAAAVALADAIAATTALSPQLKWPNDVLIDGAKTAGILVEAEHGAGRRVVLGFGVNVAHHPDEPARPATHLAAHAETTPAALFAALRPALADTLATLADPGGVGAIRARWLARAVGIGGPIIVRLDAEERAGTFAGLDPGGRLLLDLGGGRTEAIAAGDVFMRSAA